LNFKEANIYFYSSNSHIKATEGKNKTFSDYIECKQDDKIEVKFVLLLKVYLVSYLKK
jgi:hypothetical protein